MQGLRVTTRSPEETRVLGAALGREAFPGAVICLSGPLGAGKTVLAQGIAQGLGVEDAVTSPTFVYVRIHRGRLTFYHVDLYHISRPGDVDSLGLDEILSGQGVVAIEWPDRMGRDLPGARLDILIEDQRNGRAITLTPTDSEHAAVVDAIGGR